MDITGIWDVVSSHDFDDDYLRMEVDPYIKIYRIGNRLEVEYHVGLQSGDLDGLPESDDRAVFRFEGMDEMDPLGGNATATLEGDRLIFVLSFGPGDVYTFECERRR